MLIFAWSQASSKLCMSTQQPVKLVPQDRCSLAANRKITVMKGIARLNKVYLLKR